MSAQWWCRHCGKQVTVTGGDPHFGKAVHAATGSERGTPDGHVAAPIDFEPPMWKAARELADDYHGAFTLSARFGILRAHWSAKVIGAGATAAHYTAPDKDDMRRQLDGVVTGTRWERSREGAGS